MNKKKGMSVIIGYVLLISFGLVIAILVYQNMKNMVPKEIRTCEEGLGISVQKISFTGEGDLNLTLKNSGKFYISGYYLKGSKNSELDTATIDLSKCLDIEKSFLGNDDAELFVGNQIIYYDRSGTQNWNLGEEIVNVFSLSKCPDLDEMKFIEIIPIRFEELNGKVQMAVCNNAKIREVVPSEETITNL